MSSEPIFAMNLPVIANGDMSGSLSSSVIDISEVIGFAVHAIWTGSPVGNLVVEGGNDGSNFVAIDTQAAGGVAGQHLLNLERQHYRYVRCRYSFTSGTGSLTVYVSAKDL